MLTKINLVPPTEVYFDGYREDGNLEVDEDTPINITCVGPRAKPEVDINIFLNGKKITDNLKRWSTTHANQTVDAFASWVWRPTKNDHNKIISCEVTQRETNTTIRTSLTLHILCKIFLFKFHVKTCTF